MKRVVEALRSVANRPLSETLTWSDGSGRYTVPHAALLPYPGLPRPEVFREDCDQIKSLARALRDAVSSRTSNKDCSLRFDEVALEEILTGSLQISERLADLLGTGFGRIILAAFLASGAGISVDLEPLRLRGLPADNPQQAVA